MRICDNNLFGIGCRTFNMISTCAWVHNTVRMTNHRVVGARCLVISAEDEMLDEYTCIYGPLADRRT
ncbi:hypothetical protein BKA83DRAFT_4314376 [Pisolithus microcarpus]|nr:hypothetical protein BKA83DRAFT_4314376 [Pisolithus microcarpus]